MNRIHIPIVSLILAAVAPALPAFAQDGPGGIIATGAATNLRLWLRGDGGAYTNAGTTQATNTQSVQQWNDLSGRGVHAINTGTNKPTFLTAGPNGVPAISFASASTQTLLSSLNPNPGTLADLTIVVVANPTTINLGNAKLWGHDDGGFDRSVGIDTRGGTNLGYFNGSGVSNVGNVSAGTTFLATTSYLGGSPGTFSGWFNGSNIASGTGVSNAAGQTSLSIGSINPSGEFWNGTISEFIAFDRALAEGERIILENYLAAKYGFSLAANDVYTMDNSGNGNYDFDVAGIGQGSTGTATTSAMGTGMVQISAASAMAAGRFFMFGHDNQPLSMSGPNRPAGYTSRLRRTWRPSENTDIGTTTLLFNLNGISGLPANASNIALVIDRNNNGLFSDETVASTGVIPASTYAGGLATFTGVNIADGQRFTLAFTNTVALPLHLLTFTANPEAGANVIRWETANLKNIAAIELEHSELGQEFSTLERISNLRATRFSVRDEAPAGNSYYRLRIIETDGSASYSQTVRVARQKTGAGISISPNPARNTAFIQGLPGTPVVIRVTDGMGRQLNSETTTLQSARISVAGLPVGTYTISIDGAGIHHAEQIVKD
jgi:hypothetical protein